MAHKVEQPVADSCIQAGLLPRVLRARAVLLRYPALIAAAALVSLALTIYFAATGRRLLAVLV